MNKKIIRGIPREIEILLALSGLILLLPLMFTVIILIKISSKGAVFFPQKRVGRFGKEFTMYKFRTMKTSVAGLKITASDDDRITRIGKLLRKMKIDELPELWNIVRGDMSFVGPRPEVPEFVNMKNPLWQEILSYRPGITDPVTLRLRNEEHLLTGIEDKEQFYISELQPFKLRGYAWFIRHKTWKTDLRIIALTVAVVILPQIAPPPTREEMSIAFVD